MTTDIIKYDLVIGGLEQVQKARNMLSSMPFIAGGGTGGRCANSKAVGQPFGNIQDHVRQYIDGLERVYDAPQNLLTGKVDKFQQNTNRYMKSATSWGGRVFYYSSRMNKYGQAASRWGMQIRKASREMTMLAMSSLGMFFSMFTLIGTFQQLFGMVINPLKDLSSAVENVALAEAFAGDLGIDLNSIIGDTGEFVGGQMVPAWIKLQGIMAVVQVSFIKIATQLLNNEEFMGKLMDTLQKFIDAVGDGSMEKAFTSISGALFDIVGGIIDALPYFASLVDAFSPFLKYFGFFALLAVILMPILSFLNMMLAGLAAVFTIAGSAMGAMSGILVGGAGAVAGVALLPALIIIIGVLAILGIAVLGIIGFFEEWDTIINHVYDSLDNLAQKLQDSDSLIAKLAGITLENLVRIVGSYTGDRSWTSLDLWGNLQGWLMGDNTKTDDMVNQWSGNSSEWATSNTNYNNITLNISKDTDLAKLNDWLRENLNAGWIGSI
jgi:hypothetical protein